MTTATEKATSNALDILTDNSISRGISSLLDKLKIPGLVVSDIYKWLFSSPSVDTKALQKYLFLIGGFLIVSKIFRSIYNICRNWSWLPEHISVTRNFNPQSLKERYGKDCWVAITGFTHGIGLAYAKAFADLGYNLVLIGRNKDKIKHALKWVAQYNDQILTKVINLDFDADVEVLRNTVATETESIDVGIVINNAGISSQGYFTDISLQQNLRTYKVNVLTTIEITKSFLPRMLKRPSKSAIVNVGSGVGEFCSPCIGVYSFSKWYIDNWTRSLQKQIGDRIDILMMRPLGVTTEMTGMWKGPFMATPEQVVQCTLDNMGKTTVSYGALRHKVSAMLLTKLPEDQKMQIFSQGFDRMAKAAKKP